MHLHRIIFSLKTTLKSKKSSNHQCRQQKHFHLQEIYLDQMTPSSQAHHQYFKVNQEKASYSERTVLLTAQILQHYSIHVLVEHRCSQTQITNPPVYSSLIVMINHQFLNLQAYFLHHSPSNQQAFFKQIHLTHYLAIIRVGQVYLIKMQRIVLNTNNIQKTCLKVYYVILLESQWLNFHLIVV